MAGIFGSILRGAKETLTAPKRAFDGKSVSHSDVFSFLYDPGDLTGIQKDKEKKALKKIQKKRERLERAKQVQEQIRKGVIARQQIVSDSFNQGVEGSSAAIGGSGSAISQSAGNIGFINQIFQLNAAAGKRIDNLSDLERDTALVKTIGSFFVGGGFGAAAGAGASAASSGGNNGGFGNRGAGVPVGGTFNAGAV